MASPPYIPVVLQHVDSLAADGVDARIALEHRELELCRQLLARGADSEVLLPVLQDTLVELEVDGVPVIGLPARALRSHRKMVVSTGMATHLRRRRPDLLAFKGMGYLLAAYVWRRLDPRPPLACIVGGGLGDILLPSIDLALVEFEGQADVFPNSRTMTRVYDKLVPESPGIRERGAPEWDVVSVGRLDAFKNHESLLPLARRRRVVIVGDGPERPRLEEGARAYEPGAVTLKGRLPHDETLRVVARSRIMVHPSTMEGFPRVLAEAIALGVPVVVDRSVVRYPVERHGLGVAYEGDGMEVAVNALLDDPDLLAAARERCLQFGAERFGPESVGRTAETLLELARDGRHRAIDRTFPVRYWVSRLGRGLTRVLR